MSSELLDYIQAVKPSLGDAKRAKIGLLLMHYITLARVSGGRVRMENVLTASGGSFLRKVIRNMPLVRSLAFALEVDMSCMYDDSPIPDGLRRLCQKHHINVQACIDRTKELKNVRNELWDLVIFVRVATTVMAALHGETLSNLDESYRGHRPLDYKPKPKWLGLGTDDSSSPIRARDLPGAQPPRAVGVKATTSTLGYGPVPMARKASGESSAPSSSDSLGAKSKAHKRPVTLRSAPPHAVPHLARPCEFVPPSGYYYTRQQGTIGRRMY
ncbi:hypothetical protein OPQ81_001705 [Rhizoctonia solani]|nr:hypothetical protein OPQ81_001705 [Rhizoctonia solani]